MRSALFRELLDSIERRIAAAGRGHVGELFDEFAVAEADQLTAMLDVGSEAALPLARFRWARFTAAAPGAGVTDLRLAIRLLGQVPPGSPEDPMRPLRPLAAIDPDGSADVVAWLRHAKTLLDGRPDSLDDAMSVLAIVIHADLGPARVLGLTGLAFALFRRAVEAPGPVHHAAAVAVAEQALAALPADDPQRWILLTNLALIRRERFAGTGDVADLDAAITASLEGAALNPTNALVQSGLAIALRQRHGVSGAPTDLDRAVQHGRIAVELFAADDPERSMAAAHLVMALLAQVPPDAPTAALDEGIALAHSAVATADDYSRGFALRSLAAVLTRRTAHDGAPSDILLSDVLQLELVLRQLLDGDAREEFKIRLVEALTVHFHLTGDMTQLNAAVEIRRELAADQPRSRGHCLDLAVLLRMRADASGSVDDLVEGALLTVKAVGVDPDADRPDLAVLGDRLRDYGRTKDPQVLLDPVVVPLKRYTTSIWSSRMPFRMPLPNSSASMMRRPR
ncbi:hypothetical protein [Dactylosporangium sp. NPDC051541]|uniref:hypothetical protein n=1 Tax=Dactylosporangium sp. NPDC051541 TaxID=3363977 RepID=UPI003793D9FC